MPPMKTGALPRSYALDWRSFWFSHYFAFGLRRSTGVLLCGWLGWLVLPLEAVVTITFGAMCASFADTPGTWRNKAQDMLVSVLLCSAVSLSVGVSGAIEAGRWLQPLVILAVVFSSGLLLVFGRRTLGLQFTMLLSMTLTLEHHLDMGQALSHAALFVAGSAAYALYSLATAWLHRHRLQEQVLAEALYELAQELRIKAGFYREGNDAEAQFGRLLRQQMVMTERLQTARDLILSQPSSGRQAQAVRLHLRLIDFYEAMLATHTDTPRLADRMGQLPAPARLALPLVYRHLENQLLFLGQELARHHPLQSLWRRLGWTHDAQPEPFPQDAWDTLEQVLGPVPPEGSVDDRLLWHMHWLRVQQMVRRLRPLAQQVQRQASPAPGASSPADATLANAQAFVRHEPWQPALLLSQFHAGSPWLRYAVRLTAATGTAMALAALLPESGHGAWMILTVLVILKPSFSVTHERRRHRLRGTLIGCLLAALTLHLIHSPPVLMVLVFLGATVALSFVQIRYQVTAAAASFQVLILLHLMGGAGSDTAIWARVFDTLAGAAIATVFARLLPSWEYQSLPLQARRLRSASLSLVSHAQALLLDEGTEDGAFRLARKQVLDGIAALNGSLQRMSTEPEHAGVPVSDLQNMAKLSYLMLSHVAALRLSLVRRQRTHFSGPEAELVRATLARISAWLGGASLPAEAPQPPTLAATGSHVLARRLAEWQEDAWQLAQIRP
ncbi:FUSC family membrane protein [Amphibiibacter pelophylacis]|uniref:FUSC family membrane protein n=1 Tax=Amphibiibacter pelophylacis TaxID=1799477 RepID=A0ACC6P3F8_9BURK